MVKVKINEKVFDIEKGTTVNSIIGMAKLKPKYPILGAFQNNEIVELEEKIRVNSLIRPVDITSPVGLRIYSTSLSFVVIAAAKKIFPKDTLIVQHSLSGGLFMEFEKKKFLNFNDIKKLKEKTTKIIKGNLKIKKERIDIEEGIEYFKSRKQIDKINLLRNIYTKKITIYSLNGIKAFFYGPLVPATGMLKLFDLLYYPGGMVLMFPNRYSPDKVPVFREQKKIFSVFHEFEEWQNVLDVSDVGSLNEAIYNKSISRLVKISEVIHEKKFSYLADKIKVDKKIKLVLVAGPSSSGKTTFAKRLAIHLQVIGIKTATISLDNYFVSREKTPIDKDGKHDFEHIDAIDIELFNEHLIKLIEGEEIELPEYDFRSGKRKYTGNKMKLDNDQIILIEGIHGLNPKLTHYIPNIMKFKIYVSALTQLNIDNYNRIPTTDSRLIRRMVRDSKFRNYTAESTLKRWPSVRKGEGKWIFPYQENADEMFNSALIYELAVLKPEAEPLLREIGPESEVYYEAKRILNFLNYFTALKCNEIPPTSILKEFIGKSAFKY
jgi:uridine kinase